MILKQILENEITKTLGHKPSDSEFKSAIDYIYDNHLDDDCFHDVDNCLYDWCSDKCIECPECGKSFLPDEGFVNEDNGKNFCCEQCALENYICEKESAEYYLN